MSIQGDSPTVGSTARRWRLDAMEGPLRAEHSASATARPSGRRVVLSMVAVILILWFGLDQAFRGWKARYLARAEFGATRVAPLVDPLASTVPPEVAPGDWRVAVNDTHAMLLALTGSGVLDDRQLDDLRRDLAARVAEARPETARSTLARLWDDLEQQAGPVIAPDSAPPPPRSRQAARHPRPPRPKILGPSTTR